MIIEKLRKFAPRSMLRPIAHRDHVQGPVNAPLTLVEYGDYECPGCREAYPIIRVVQEHFLGRLCFAFRHFPLTACHPHAGRAAEAAEAAAAQGFFWQMHDMLLQNQNALDNEDLLLRASTFVFDLDRFISELLNGTHAPRVTEDYRSGARSGVEFTPTLFVNGVRFDGEISENALIVAFMEHTIS